MIRGDFDQLEVIVNRHIDDLLSEELSDVKGHMPGLQIAVANESCKYSLFFKKLMIY